MANMQEMQNGMTIFYYKSNGDIYSASTGIQDINIYFGSHSKDLSLILDYVVLNKDMDVINKPKDFKINITTKSLEILPSAINTSYPVASS